MRSSSCAQWPANLPTVETVNSLRNALANRLSKCPEMEGATALSRRLLACHSTAPCGSGACSRCIRAHQIWLATVGMEAWTALSDASTAGTYFATLVPTRLAEPGRETLPKSFKIARSRLERGLTIAGIEYALGALDVSINESSAQPDGVPCVHAHLLLRSGEVADWQKRLRKFFPPTPAVPRPVQLKPWDGRADALAYALRPEIERRITITCAGSEHRGPHQKTRRRDLRVEQQVDMALRIDKVGIVPRFIHRGFELDASGDIPTLVPLSD